MARIDGVNVYFHWSTFLVIGLILVGSLPRLQVTLVAVAAYFAIVMVHEWGHVVAARRRHCVAWSIEIYPIIGLTRISAAASYFDECVIAWGGVLAQLAVAAPLITWVALFGFTSSDQTNAVLGLLGYLSILIAVMNLLPAPGLDGAKAWPLIPLLFSRAIGAYRQRSRSRGRRKKKRWARESSNIR